MKTLKLGLVLLIAVSAVKGQTLSRYNSAVEKGLKLLDSARTADQFTVAGNHFERIAAGEPTQWLPGYYAGYCNLLSAVLGNQNAETKDAIYNKAMGYANKANALKPASSEILVLEAYITFMKMSVSPQNRAMSMIPQADKLLEQAMTLNPENPRAYLVKGQNTFYTPEAFGGGKTKAKAFLALAADKYKRDSPASSEPSWGAGRCQELLRQCN